MNKPLDAKLFYDLMVQAADKVGYLSGHSLKVLVALALRPESRESLIALKRVTCIDDNTDLVAAISELESFNYARYDGKGGIVVQESLFHPK